MNAAISRPQRFAAIERGIAAWYDAAHDGRATWILLGLFVIAWTGFHVLAYASFDLHPDLVEIFAWSRHPAVGYSKHPPLGSLMAAAWFFVFPVADWSFYLFTMVNAAIGLFAVDLIARRYVDGDKRLLVLLLLLFTPFYQFHGQRFGSNQVLLSTWPLATYCFLRAFETRTLLWSAAAGATAALAMLGKYYSIYLIGALVVAALVHPRRFDYLRSASPWISTIAGLVVLAPHLHWLVATGAQPIHYAMSVHASDPAAEVARRVMAYVLGAVGYVLLPLVVFALAVHPDHRALADAAWPADPDRRMLVVLLVAPLMLPLFTAPFFGISLSSLWTAPAWFLLPVVLLSSPQIVLARTAAIRVAAVVLATTVLALAAAPGIAWIRHVDGGKEGRSYYRAVSKELTRVWRETMQRPLTIVSGDFDLANAATFYSDDHPDALPGHQLVATPWVTPERLAREGFASVCRAEDQTCITSATKRTANTRNAVRVTYAVTVPFWGVSSPPARFVFVLVPPNE